MNPAIVLGLAAALAAGGALAVKTRHDGLVGICVLALLVIVGLVV